MKTKTLSLIIGSLAMAGAAVAIPITNATQGRYVTLGTTLDGSSFMFPIANSAGGDPVLNIPASSAPNLSAAAAQLGSWLTNPAAPGGSWSGQQAIPTNWAVNTESAIIYTVNSTTGFDNVVASFGVDNGIFLWVDGTFRGGFLRPGGATPNEHVFNIGSLSAGNHYIQVLREDHGGGTGYNVNITGDVAAVPEPGSYALMALGLIGMAAVGRRRARRV